VKQPTVQQQSPTMLAFAKGSANSNSFSSGASLTPPAQKRLSAHENPTIYVHMKLWSTWWSICAHHFGTTYGHSRSTHAVLTQ